jgi:hypothetical protein
MFIRFALPFKVSRKGFCFGSLSFARKRRKKEASRLDSPPRVILPSPVFDLGAVLHADEDRHYRAWAGGGLRRVSHTLFSAAVQRSMPVALRQR